MREGFKTTWDSTAMEAEGSVACSFPGRAACSLGLLTCGRDHFSGMQSLRWWRWHWGRI